MGGRIIQSDQPRGRQRPFARRAPWESPRVRSEKLEFPPPRLGADRLIDGGPGIRAGRLCPHRGHRGPDPNRRGLHSVHTAQPRGQRRHAVAGSTSSAALGKAVTLTYTAGSPAAAYTASYAGNSMHEAVTTARTVSILRAPVTLTLKESLGIAGYHQPVTLTARLGATYANRDVSIYAQPYGTTTRRLIKSGRVSASGNLSVRYAPATDTTFSAVFAGDARYAEDGYHSRRGPGGGVAGGPRLVLKRLLRRRAVPGVPPGRQPQRHRHRHGHGHAKQEGGSALPSNLSSTARGTTPPERKGRRQVRPPGTTAPGSTSLSPGRRAHKAANSFWPGVLSLEVKC